MKGWRLAWRFFKRDLAAGEVRVLLAALALAVMAVASVAFVTERAQRALELESNRLLGGDVLLRADSPIGEVPREVVRELGLRMAETWTFRSMVRAGEGLHLFEVRALGEGFPLRGEYRLDAGAGEFATKAIPRHGAVWVSRSGAQRLGLEAGGTVKLGEGQFRIEALVAQEPDSAMDYFNLSPRIFLRLDDVAATGLVREGSRVGYRLAVAGEDGAAQGFADRMRDRLERGQRLETIADARPEVRSSLERAERFLGLAALVAVVLAAIAVAMAARRHSARHLDGCAVLRCLGASQNTILTVYLGEVLLLGAIGCALGIAGAWLIQSMLGGVLAQVMGIAVPKAGIAPVLHGVAVGFVVLLAFAVPPVIALRRVPALRVLRRDLGAVEAGALAVSLSGLAGLAALIWQRAGSAELGAAMLGGLAANFAVLALLAYGLVLVVRRLRSRLPGAWRYGLANVARRPAASIAQIAALGLGLMAILLLTLVRTDLLDRWKQSMPEDAANRFIINVQSDQVDGVAALLREHGIAQPELFPMVRARLVEVNGVPVSGESYAARGERAQRLAEREFNLSSSGTLREADNQIVAGQFWSPGDATAQFSVEEGMAKGFGWKIGDEVMFDIAGSRVQAPITSLRKVDWESFRPNFFVLASPGALDGMAASHVTAAKVPRGDARLTRALVAAYPNISVIDIDAVIDQVRNTVSQVTAAVEYVFYFTLLAGVLVLLASISASQDERLLEGGVMRVLGARTRQLRLAQASEFIALGLIAGLVAAIAASVVSGVIAVNVFDQEWAPDWRVAALGAGVGVLVVTLAGLIATRAIASQPPSQTLRALGG